MEIIDLSTTPTKKPQDGAGAGLRSLSAVTLSSSHQRMLEKAAEVSGGPPQWQGRKSAEARDVLALSEIAPRGRLQVGWIDMQRELRILLLMRVPVPRRPDANNELPVDRQALLGLTYPQEAVQLPLPGTAFLDVLEPWDVWHANVGPVGPQPVETNKVLCLGPTLPAGIRCVDLIVAAYGALSMQNVQIDEQDPAGVLNAQAARWWQQNMHRVPLSRTPFLVEDE